MKNKNTLLVIFGASLLVLVLTITVSVAGQKQELREHAVGFPSQEGLPNQTWRNPYSNTNHPLLTITLSPENMRYKAPNNTIPPTLTITSPQNGTVVQPGNTVAITAVSSERIGVAKVEFLVNSAILCTVTVAPYTCSWTVPDQPATTYLIVVRASDQTGNITSKNVVAQSR